jgi:hypothetical protein
MESAVDAMIKIDTLFNLLGVLLFFIIALLAQVNPPATPDIAQPGNIIVFATWPEGPDDVDLWVQHANTTAVGYSNKSGKVWSLLRDDLGVANDITNANMESAFSRGIPDGEYAVNVKCFACIGKMPIVVAVEVRLATGELIWRGTVELVANKQERTAVRWKMAGGRVVKDSASSVFKQMKRGE